MPNWKKVITSGSNAHLNHITASGKVAIGDDLYINDAGYTTSNVTNPYTPNNPETWLQRRNSQMEKLNRGICMKLQIYGNTFLACGDIINVNIPVVAAENIKSQIPADQLDKLYKGNFLIKAIRHDFQCSESTHWMHMKLLKIV